MTGVSQQRVATRAAAGPGINAAGAAPGARGHPRSDSTARGCSRPRCRHGRCPPRALVPSWGEHRGRCGSWCLQSPFNSAIPGATALLWFKAGAAEPSPSVWVLLSFRCPQGSSSSRKIQGPFRGKEGWIWLLLPSGPERTMDIGPSRIWCVSSPRAMSITAWVLHPCLLARPASETTHKAENQAGSLHWRCCLPPWSSPRRRNSGSGLHSHTSAVSLPASTQPLAQQAVEPHVAKTQCGGFGAGVHHFPKLSQAERATLSVGPWQTNPRRAVLQILLAVGFGFQQKDENKVSKEKNKVPKEGKWNILNKFDEKKEKHGAKCWRSQKPAYVWGWTVLPSLPGPRPTRAGPTPRPGHQLQRGRPSPAAPPHFSVGFLLAISKK